MSLITLTLLMALVFMTYVIVSVAKFGFEDMTSISATSYLWQGKNRFIFFGWLALIGILCWFQQLGYWGDVMSMGFMWAGLTLNHRKGDMYWDEIHTAGTTLAIVSGFGGLIALHGIILPAVAMVVFGYLIYRYVKNPIFWIELLAFLTLTIGLLMR